MNGSASGDTDYVLVPIQTWDLNPDGRGITDDVCVLAVCDSSLWLFLQSESGCVLLQLEALIRIWGSKVIVIEPIMLF